MDAENDFEMEGMQHGGHALDRSLHEGKLVAHIIPCAVSYEHRLAGVDAPRLAHVQQAVWVRLVSERRVECRPTLPSQCWIECCTSVDISFKTESTVDIAVQLLIPCYP